MNALRTCHRRYYGSNVGSSEFEGFLGSRSGSNLRSAENHYINEICDKSFFNFIMLNLMGWLVSRTPKVLAVS